MDILVRPVKNDSTLFYCRACKKSFACGKSNIERHENTKGHEKACSLLKFDDERHSSQVASHNTSDLLDSMHNVFHDEFIANYPLESVPVDLPPESESVKDIDDISKSTDLIFAEKVAIAELRIALFFVDKNISFHISKELIELVKELAGDPGVLEAVSLGPRKLCKIVNNVLASQEMDRITDVLRETKFSVYVGETSDRTNEKWLSLLARYIDPETLKANCVLLQMINVDASDCSAEKVFESFRNALWKKQIALSNIVGLSCDNTNAMVGKFNSLQSRLKAASPNLILCQCVCHYSALDASAACVHIPQFLDETMKAISTFLNSSPKRTKIFREMMLTLLGHVEKLKKLALTRWLSRHHCVRQLIEHYNFLPTFFMEQASEKVLKAD